MRSRGAGYIVVVAVAGVVGASWLFRKAGVKVQPLS